GSDPAQLEIEITESVAVGGIDPIIKLLEEIRARGVSFALDDFGTGYSSLSYLQKLPADRLKIDRSFVSALEKNDQGTRIARTIILLGHELELEVIAEGVESQSTADVLVALGCETAQGYYFAKPLAEKDLLALLSETPDFSAKLA
ncbi:MAG TPA: EAL domain-containing protein, partial [Alphaproteobacteria bacterium]|nr:EAL domain-containing protein [Alphaproteobacteria bacterium]